MICIATAEDAHVVHQVMLAAFEEYRQLEVPSSALNETADSIKKSLHDGQQRALLYYQSGEPVGCCRFQTDGESLYFSRLSVRPAMRRRGIAKSMIQWLEAYAAENHLAQIRCRVRTELDGNVLLYQSIGFEVVEREVVTNPNGFSVDTVVMRKSLHE